MKSQPEPRVLNGAATAILKSVFARTVDPKDPGRPVLDPHNALTDIARSVAVLGDLLGGLSDQYFKAGKKYASMMATLGQVFWGIVELSVPDSLGSRFLRHWLAVLTALAVLMIAFGLIFHVNAMA